VKDWSQVAPGMKGPIVLIGRQNSSGTYDYFREVVCAKGKDGKTYGRLTKAGVLSAGMEGGEATLTCTVNTEGSEG